MSKRRRKQTSWGTVIVLCIAAIALFSILPTWAQVIVIVFAVLASIEAFCQALLKFSLIEWVWNKIV